MPDLLSTCTISASKRPGRSSKHWNCGVKASISRIDFRDPSGEQIPPAQDDHVVVSCGDFAHAAHGARSSGNKRTSVAGPVAHNRQGVFAQRGEDQLAIFAIGQDFSAEWIDDLG